MSSTRLKWSLSLLALALVAVAAVASAQSVKARYPYDPACAWGRIANGKGMLVRCMTEQEAVALVKVQEGKPAPQPAEEKSPEKPEEPADGGSEVDKPLSVEVGPIKADKGKLGVGRLHVPKDRYAACVDEHGGLEGTSGEVHVRFLVRGDRSRAEGVSVSKRRNMSREAAKCVADVVDRRRVGTPEAPMVGATLIIKFTR